MKNIVEVTGIVKTYGSVIAVNNVSFNVKEGEFFSLLGPSGCGKTTILRILGGFIDQDSGTVKIDNSDMRGIAPNKRNTSMVFQNLALFPHMNVEENIVYGLKKRRTPEKIINEKLKKMLSLVNLSELQKRRTNELSGGQQQRVALARSLILEPKILLLDEPLASLDKKLRVSMRAELKEIQKTTGTTFLYVTHDQSEALTMSDTIAVMNSGKIIQTGDPDNIYNYPIDFFVADFIGAGNFISISDVKISDGVLKALTFGAGEIIIGKDLYLKSKQCTSEEILYKIKNKSSKNAGFVFFIRPEKVKISAEPLIKPSDSHIKKISADQFSNQFRAEITSRIFEGPDTRLTLFSEQLGTLTAEIKNDELNNSISEGENIYIWWNIKEGCLLAR